MRSPRIRRTPSTVDAKDTDASEEKLFDQEAILFRFDATAKGWKERGVGFSKSQAPGERAVPCAHAPRAGLPRVREPLHPPGHGLTANGEPAVIWLSADFADGKASNEVRSAKAQSQLSPRTFPLRILPRVSSRSSRT
jgi:hypothetical protein